MIEIRKIKNWYGIKELTNPNLIYGNTIIYSPNGVMKTSFSDGFKDILSNLNPKDVFNNIDSEYEIINNGRLINELDNEKKLDVIVFSGEEIRSDFFSNPNIAKLVISQKLKKKYDEEINKITKRMDEMNTIVTVEVLKGKKVNDKNIKKLFDSNNSNELDAMIGFIDCINNDIEKEDDGRINIIDLFTKKNEEMFTDSDFVKKCIFYNHVLKATFDTLLFNSGFKFKSLEEIKSILESNHFFDAGHKIELNKQTYDLNDLSLLIDNITLEVYGSSAVKEAALEIETILDSKGNTKLKNIIHNNLWIIPHLSSPNELKQRMINTRLEARSKEIDEIKKELLQCKKEVENVLADAKKEYPIWLDVIRTYNERFLNKHFTIEITNSSRAIVDMESPIFEKKLKNSGKLINDEIEKRFSSGERRAIYILYLLFEIKMAKLNPEKFTLILDDIVDSFDYKNKYALIEYLKELSIDKKIQLIILTHNFDFYRSCRIALKPNLVSKLLAYENKDCITLYDAKSEEYETYVFFTNWKSQEKTLSLIGCIPLLRNIIHLKDGGNCKYYEILTHFLHYDLETRKANLGDLDQIFKNYNIKTSCDYNDDLYFKKLVKEANSIIACPPQESKLLEKIVLGIFIRIGIDKILLDKYVFKQKKDPVIGKGLNWTKEIFKLVKNDLTQYETSLYNQASTIAPSFIHINGFMFEPLIDVGLERMIKVASNIIKKI